MKSGRFTKREIQFIKDNVNNMTYIQLAAQLERSEDSVKKHIEDKLGLKTNLSVDSRPVSSFDESSIRSQPIWAILEKQLEQHELEYFEYTWNKYFHDQFHGDVLPTEESQLCDVVKLEILMDRNLKEQKSSSSDISDMEIRIEQEMAKPTDVAPPIGRNEEEIYDMKKQISFLRTSQAAHGKEYRELLDKKDKMFMALKGVRKDRIQRIESSKKSFPQWMSEIVSNPVLRRELGQRMEKMRLSIIDEEVRLSAYHKYEDGKIDQPLLNAKTVKEDNNKPKES